MAASATFALKAGVWFRRGRLVMVSPDSLAQRARCQAETPPIVLCRFPKPVLITNFREPLSQRCFAGCNTAADFDPKHVVGPLTCLQLPFSQLRPTILLRA